MKDIRSLPAPEPEYENLNNLKASPHTINNLSDDQDVSDSAVEKVNVDQVVEEVESLLNRNPKLPRLTRGEIVELLENITHEDSEHLQKERGQKAIMLVMPYTPNNPNDNMEEFYTKPPITKIIENGKESFKRAPEVPAFKPLKADTDRIKNENLVKEFNDGFEVSKQTTIGRPITSTTQSTTITTARPAATKRPLRRKQSTPKRRQHYKTTTSSTTPKISTASLELITESKLSETPKVRRRPPVTQKPLSIEDITYKPTHQSAPSYKKTTTFPEHHPNHKYPEDDEKADASNEAIRVISPPKFLPKVTKKPEYALKTTLSFGTDKPEDVLDSIHIPENMKTIVKDLDTLMQEGNTKFHQILPIIDEPTTPTPLQTTTTVPDVSEMADNLSPDMRELLMSFGLIPNPNYKPEPFKLQEPQPNLREEAEITRDSYLSFKPLPANAPTRKDMEELLSEFGLKDSSRDGKAIASNTKKSKNQLSFDMVPDSHKHILKDVGLTEELASKNQHVFNPQEKPTASPEELDRLEKLLDMIKQLEKLNNNGNVTEDTMKQFDMEKLKDLVDTFNKPESLDAKPAPDPLNYDSGLVKNEVKRQESSSSTTSTTTTQEPARNPSLEDLEASFGGVAETVSEATLPETTTAKRTGFYYLVDWNSFFDIDNQKGKRVNLRFQPKVGDPRNFLRVTVP